MATINITGTGGIIEGNLGTSNVNVNLDSSLYFDGNVNDDRIVVSDDNTAATGDFGTGNFSVSLWIYVGENGFDTSDTWGSIISKGFTTSAPANTWSILRTASNNNISFQGASNAGGAFPINMAIPSGVVLGAWNHVAFTRNGTSVKLYHQGQLVNSATASETGNFSNSGDFKIGTNHSNAQSANGSIADVKLFSDELTAAEVQYLSSKVQADPDVGGLDNCESWWKINEGTGTNVVNHKKGSANGTITGAEWQYDKFSVDVYDNSTTTDGTFTVTQGKVEGKALTSLDFDGVASEVDCGSPSSLDDTFNGTASWGFWIKPDSDGENNFGRVVEKTQWEIYLEDESSGKTRITLNVNRGTTAGRWRSERIVEIDKWNHLLWVYDGSSTSNDPVLYLNGVAQTLTESSTPNGSITSDASANLNIGNRDGNDRTFDGHIKDVRYYDYLLSAEQAASLYSNTYPQTPNHHWKFDEGSGGNGDTVADTGTETAANGTLGPAGFAPNFSNGTLDLDFDLVIYANGILSAPRGDLSLVRNFQNSGTYTHNNGTFAAVAGDNTFINTTGTVDPVFYNVRLYAQQLRFYQSTTIERQLQLDSTATHCYIWANKTLTMGSATNPETNYPKLKNNLNTGDKQFWFYAGDGETATLQGVSELYPIIYTNTNGSSIEWGYHANGVAQVKNIDFQFDITTDTATTNNIKLTGDCEFDAVTVSSGDSLDINGQRVEFGGDVTYQGTIDADGLLVFHGGFTKYGTLNNAASGDIMTMSTSGFPTFSYITGYRTFFANGGVQLGTGGFTSIPTAIVASGELRTGTRNTSATNLTIATGATFDADANTHTVSGDFTISGGLIGKSAVVFDNNTSHIINSTLASGPSTAITLEAWVKSDDVTQYQSVIIDQNQIVHLAIYNSKLYVWTDTDASDRVSVSGVTTLTNNKWHHLAMAWDAATDTMLGYVDGKLDISATSAGSTLHSTPTNFAVGRRQDFASQAFDGVIAMTRIFNVARTQAQLRTDMFNDFDSMSSTTGLLQMFQFDEGTGTSVDDVSANSNTGTITGAAWAGTGTLDDGTSTLDFTGNGEWAISDTTTNYYNVKVAASGKTTTINSVGSSERRPRITNLLTHGGGTLTDINNADIVFHGTGTHTAGADLSGLYITYWPSSTDMPGGTYQFLITQHNDLSTTGDITCTGYFAISSNEGFDLKNQTLTTPRFINYASSTFNMDAGSLVFTSTQGLTGDYTGRTFTAGPGATIDGVAAKSGFFSENNYQIVGDISDLDVTNEELTVVGTVTNCTGDILQFTPGHDTTLSLETDTAEDRDIRLGGPSLDNANHLIAE